MTNKPKDDLDAVREVVEAIKSFSEEEQKRIIKWSCEKLGIDCAAGQIRERTTTQLPPDEQVLDHEATRFSKPKDIKTFIESKNPKTDKHFAAVVAYYYQFEAPEKKDSVTKKDLVEATRQANWDRLIRPDQTLVNATNSGLLDNISRGHYRLNSVGENLVAMVLPNSVDELPKIKSKKPKQKKTLNRGKKK